MYHNVYTQSYKRDTLFNHTVRNNKAWTRKGWEETVTVVDSNTSVPEAEAGLPQYKAKLGYRSCFKELNEEG